MLSNFYLPCRRAGMECDGKKGVDRNHHQTMMHHQKKKKEKKQYSGRQ